MHPSPRAQRLPLTSNTGNRQMVNPQNTGRHTSNAKTFKTSQRTRRKPHQENHRPVNDSTMNHAALFFFGYLRHDPRKDTCEIIIRFI